MPESAWPTIHAERKALADDLEGLTPEQWQTPSLCTGWSVLDVLGHQLATAKMTPLSFFGHFAGAGFSFDKMANKDIQREVSQGAAATLKGFRAVQNASTSPPGPKDSWLGEALVHSHDIRHPLGIKHNYPTDAVTRAVAFYAGTNVIIPGKKRTAGLTLKANDADWSLGEGPVVEGPAMSLLMAVVGRKSAAEGLTGPGAETLLSR